MSRQTPIVFIHGLWLHAESWDPWINFFNQHGYETMAVNWPGDADTTAATCANGHALAGYGVVEIADYIVEQIKHLPVKPILIGHSFGGLLVQNILGRDHARAAIAIDPAPIKGVWELPLPALKAAFPVLRNPLNLNKAISLTEPQFRYGFTNAISEDEAKQLYKKYAMPAPARPIFQAATATFNPWSATKVNVKNSTRGPLLLIAGGKDNTVPPVLVKSALRLYKKSRAVTEMKEFADRGHSLVIDSGWQEVAQSCLQWVQRKNL
ncbi:MAG: alpha/beta hydrolase [Anaerolineae bacterium]